MMKELGVVWVMSDLTLGSVWAVDLLKNELIVHDIITTAQVCLYVCLFVCMFVRVVFCLFFRVMNSRFGRLSCMAFDPSKGLLCKPV